MGNGELRKKNAMRRPGGSLGLKVLGLRFENLTRYITNSKKDGAKALVGDRENSCDESGKVGLGSW